MYSAKSALLSSQSATEILELFYFLVAFRFSLRLHIDIREVDTKSSLGSTSVAKEKSNLFKFRRNQDKILVIGVSQPNEGPTEPPIRIIK